MWKSIRRTSNVTLVSAVIVNDVVYDMDDPKLSPVCCREYRISALAELEIETVVDGQKCVPGSGERLRALRERFPHKKSETVFVM